MARGSERMPTMVPAGIPCSDSLSKTEIPVEYRPSLIRSELSVSSVSSAILECVCDGCCYH